MTLDLLANRKRLSEILESFNCDLRNLEADVTSCINGVTAFVLDNKYKEHNFAQLLIGHNYAHLKSGAFSLDMSI